MGTEKMSDFGVTSNGHCFFCLNQIMTLKPGVNIPSPLTKQNNSLQYLSRYLKMDMKKVFIDKGQVSPELLAKVEKARLKVELCEECSSLNEGFSKVYQKLEKLEVELASTLGLILRKLENADAMDKLKGLTTSSNSRWNGLFEVLDVLRAEAIQKSSIKLSRTSRVKIRNLSQQEIKEKQCRLSLKKNSKTNPRSSQLGTSTGTDFVSSHNLEASKLKGESYLSDENLSDNDNRNHFSDDGDSNLDTATMEDDAEAGNQDISRGDTKQRPCKDNNDEDIVIENLAIEVKHVVSPPARAQYVSWADKYNINPETGKPKCNACHMEFKTTPSFIYHYQTVHLKQRYKCVLCSKLFISKRSLTLHQRTSGSCSAAESAPKFKCHLCEKSFSQKQSLQTHLDGIHFKVLKYECNICDKKFITKVALFQHRRQVHRGMK